MPNYLKPKTTVNLEKLRLPDGTVPLGTFDRQSLISFLQNLQSPNLVVYLYQDSDSGPVRMAIGEADSGSLPTGRHELSLTSLPCPKWCPS